MKNFDPSQFMSGTKEEMNALKMLNNQIEDINERIKEGIKMEFSDRDPIFHIEVKMNGNMDIIHLDYPRNCPPHALAKVLNRLTQKIRTTCLKRLDDLAKDIEAEEVKYQPKKVGTI